MRLTVLGGGGPWPVRGQGCSGYLLTHHDTTVLIDPGPGTLGELLALHRAHDVDAVVVSHSHADHTADLISLLRARRMARPPAAPLPVFAPSGALRAVLALDPAEVVADSVESVDVGDGAEVEVAGIRLQWRELAHHVPNLGVRLQAGAAAMAYTGDSGDGDAIVDLASGVALLLAEATYLTRVPEEDNGLLNSATEAGKAARFAGVGQLVLTHLWPGADPGAACAAARHHFAGPVSVAHPGFHVDISP